MKEYFKRRQKHHQTKHGLHPVLPILLAFIGAAIVSMVFGLLLFPIFTGVCAEEFLYAVRNMGYAGVVVLCAGLLLEAYNLYEHHRGHVQLLVGTSLLLSISIVILMSLVSGAYSC